MNFDDLPIFVYGTLRDAQVRNGVLGRGAASLPAAAPGWRTVYYPGEHFPALVPCTGRVEGLLLTDITPTDRARLDAFEGRQYYRGPLTVETVKGTMPAQAYFPTVQIDASAASWSFAGWTSAHRTAAIVTYRATEFSGHEDGPHMYDHDTYDTAKGSLTITPIHHATLALQWDDQTILCDPVGSADRYSDFADPALIVLTHHHGDHFDLETLAAVVGEDTAIIAPQIVFDQLPSELAARTKLMANGDTSEMLGMKITAVAMYNTTPEREKYHEKGVGNGYVLDFAGTRVYLASDTEPTAEMDAVGAVDIAFFPMNLPYTMTPDQVVTCIEKTQPGFVYPFHYRFPFDEPGTEPQELVEIMPAGAKTEIVVRDWYKPV